MGLEIKYFEGSLRKYTHMGTINTQEVELEELNDEMINEKI